MSLTNKASLCSRWRSQKSTNSQHLRIGYGVPNSSDTSVNQLLPPRLREHHGRRGESLRAGGPGCLLWVSVFYPCTQEISTIWSPKQDLHSETSWHAHVDGRNPTRSHDEKLSYRLMATELSVCVVLLILRLSCWLDTLISTWAVIT